MEPVASGALSSIANAGIVGAIAALCIVALWIIMNRRDKENQEHKQELLSALVAERARLDSTANKLQTVMETTVANNTQAMNSNTEATKENTRVLKNVPCLAPHFKGS